MNTIFSSIATFTKINHFILVVCLFIIPIILITYKYKKQTNKIRLSLKNLFVLFTLLVYINFIIFILIPLSYQYIFSSFFIRSYMPVQFKIEYFSGIVLNTLLFITKWTIFLCLIYISLTLIQFFKFTTYRYK